MKEKRKTRGPISRSISKAILFLLFVDFKVRDREKFGEFAKKHTNFLKEPTSLWFFLFGLCGTIKWAH